MLDRETLTRGACNKPRNVWIGFGRNRNAFAVMQSLLNVLDQLIDAVIIWNAQISYPRLRFIVTIAASAFTACASST